MMKSTGRTMGSLTRKGASPQQKTLRALGQIFAISVVILMCWIIIGLLAWTGVLIWHHV